MMAVTIDEIEVLIKAQTAGFRSEIKSVRQELKQLESVSRTSSKGVSAGMIAMGTVVGQVVTGVVSKALSGLNSVLAESDQAYRETSASLTKLATVMKQRGATQAQFNEVVKLTEAEERLGVVSASAQQNGLQELATYVGKAESLKRLTNVMNNLIVQQHGYNATADQALQTATMMGKVLQGQTGGMERIGYHLDEADVKMFNYGTEEERVALLAEIVNDNLGDMNRELGKTNVGKQVQLANTWASLRAQIGELSTAVKNLLAPAFSVVVNVVARAVAYTKAFFKLFGVDTGNSAENAAGAIDSAAGAVDNYGNAAEDASKKAKKALASFDEMNVLTENKGASEDGGGVDILGDLAPAVDKIDWGSLIPDIELPKWLKELPKLFEGLDLTKISKSFKQFGKDVDKFLTPAKKILGDVWNTYLKPFVTWVGNSFLPAFMNALGGSIAVVGEVLGNVWDTLLKPFIDAFLVPIANFTGGVIVDVLNGIGNALRGIAANSAAVETISLIVKSLLILAGINLAAGFATGVINAMTGGALAFNGFLAVLSKTTGGLDLFNKAGAAGAGMIDGLKNALGGLTSGISALGAPLANLVNGFTGATAGSSLFISSLGAGLIVMEAVVAVIVAIQVAMEYFKLKTMEAELAEQEFITAQEMAKMTEDAHNDAIQRQIDLKKELEGLTKSLADAQLALLSAQEAVEKAQSKAEATAAKYNMTMDEARAYVESLDTASGNLTAKDKALAEAVFELDSKEGSLKDAISRVTEKKNEQAYATEELEKQQWKEVWSQQQAEAEALLAAGKYDELRQKIIDLKNSNGEYTLENGEKCKINKENMQSMAEFIGDRLAQIDEDNGKAWKSIWNAADRTVDNLNKDTAKQLSEGGKTAGVNWAEGVGKGAESKKGWLGTTISNIAGGMLKGFKDFFGIHSPSRVMAQIGSYLIEGMGVGMESEETTALAAAKGIGSAIMGEFANVSASIPDIVGQADFANMVKMPELNSNALSQISEDIELREQPIMLSATLQIDGQDVPVSLNFAQHIADSINDLSMLRNTSVIRV